MITEEQIKEGFSALHAVIDKHQKAFSGTFEQKSQFGAQLQWLIIVRSLAEICQHGTKEEVREITNALHDTLVEVVFK